MRSEAASGLSHQGRPMPNLHTNLKWLFGLQRRGNNTDTFMRDTLAPLIAAPMPTFNALKRSVLDRLP